MCSEMNEWECRKVWPRCNALHHWYVYLCIYRRSFCRFTCKLKKLMSARWHTHIQILLEVRMNYDGDCPCQFYSLCTINVIWNLSFLDGWWITTCLFAGKSCCHFKLYVVERTYNRLNPMHDVSLCVSSCSSTCCSSIFSNRRSCLFVSDVLFGWVLSLITTSVFPSSSSFVPSFTNDRFPLCIFWIHLLQCLSKSCLEC